MPVRSDASANDAPASVDSPGELSEVDDVYAHPERFVGSEIKVVGEASSVYDEQAFELESLDWIIDEDILVVTGEPLRFAYPGKLGEVRDEDILIVVGQLEPFTANLASSLRGREFGTSLHDRWQGKYILAARKVSSARHASTWEASKPTPVAPPPPTQGQQHPESIEHEQIEPEQPQSTEDLTERFPSPA